MLLSACTCSSCISGTFSRMQGSSQIRRSGRRPGRTLDSDSAPWAACSVMPICRSVGPIFAGRQPVQPQHFSAAAATTAERQPPAALTERATRSAEERHRRPGDHRVMLEAPAEDVCYISRSSDFNMFFDVQILIFKAIYAD